MFSAVVVVVDDDDNYNFTLFSLIAGVVFGIQLLFLFIKKKKKPLCNTIII